MFGLNLEGAVPSRRWADTPFEFIEGGPAVEQNASGSCFVSVEILHLAHELAIIPADLLDLPAQSALPVLCSFQPNPASLLRNSVGSAEVCKFPRLCLDRSI